MNQLEQEYKANLYNQLFPTLQKMLKDYHNDSSKISVGNRLNLSADGSRLKSLTLGVRGPAFLSIRKDKTLSPHLTLHTQTPMGFNIYKQIYTIIGLVFPTFEFNSIIVNYNSNFLIHKDKKNIYENSVMFTIGDHEGGKIIIYDDDKIELDRLYIDKYPIKFAGKSTYHSTEPFTGTRYCIVAYQTKPKYHFDPFLRESYLID